VVRRRDAPSESRRSSRPAEPDLRRAAPGPRVEEWSSTWPFSGSSLSPARSPVGSMRLSRDREGSGLSDPSKRSFGSARHRLVDGPVDRGLEREVERSRFGAGLPAPPRGRPRDRPRAAEALCSSSRGASSHMAEPPDSPGHRGPRRPATRPSATGRSRPTTIRCSTARWPSGTRTTPSEARPRSRRTSRSRTTLRSTKVPGIRWRPPSCSRAFKRWLTRHLRWRSIRRRAPGDSCCPSAASSHSADVCCAGRCVGCSR
jgi:hypothetical protein